MKKFLVIALATFAVIGQAQAQRDVRARDVRGEEARRIEVRDKVLAKTSPEVSRIATEINTQNLDGQLSPMRAKRLAFSLGKAENADLLKVAGEIAAASKAKPALKSLSQERIEGLSNLAAAKMQPPVHNLEYDFALPEEKATQAYAILVISAGKQASGTWTAETAKNMELMLKTANTELARGKSFDAAMEEARRVLKQEAKIDIKLEDLKRLCKA